MGEQAFRYRQRKIAAASGAAHELELYQEPESRAPRPCHCEWNMLERRLLELPDPEPEVEFWCACVGPVAFDVPGYPNDDTRMRRFCRERLS